MTEEQKDQCMQPLSFGRSSADRQGADRDDTSGGPGDWQEGRYTGTGGPG